MISKSELKRRATVNPLWAAQQVEILDREVRRLRMRLEHWENRKIGEPFFTTDDFENESSDPGFTTTTQAALDANAKTAPLLERVNRVEAALALFFEFNRKRGYPTGFEWTALLAKARLTQEGK